MEESTKQRVIAAVAAMAGALAPDVLIIYSKRWGENALVLPAWQFFAASLAYLAIAGIIGGIFPYRPRPSAWQGFAVGVGTPVILSALAAAAKPASLAPRGVEIAATWWDLLALW
jgi:hypothetical protein